MESSPSKEHSRTTSALSTRSHFSNEAAEGRAGMPAGTREDVVYVAVAAKLERGKATLAWAIQHYPSAKAFVIVHIHIPPTPTIGSSAARQSDRAKMNKGLDKYVAMCSQLKVPATKLVTENDDVAKGLVDLIAKTAITKLVMGAAADSRYSEKMKELKSKTAISVKQNADPSCTLWFVCKGRLICTREASLYVSQRDNSVSSNHREASLYVFQRDNSVSSDHRETSPYLSHRDNSGSSNHRDNSVSSNHRDNSVSSNHREARPYLSHRDNSVSSSQSSIFSLQLSQTDNSPSAAQSSSSSPHVPRSSTSRGNESINLFQDSLQHHSRDMSADFPTMANQESRLSIPIRSTDLIAGISNVSQSSASNSAAEPQSYESILLLNDTESESGLVNLSSLQDYKDDLKFSSPLYELKSADSEDEDLFGKLRAALKDAEQFYKESRKQWKNEKQRAKELENLYATEMRDRKEIEEALDREKLEVEVIKNKLSEALHREKSEVENAKNELDEISGQLKIETEKKLELERELAKSIPATKYLEDQLTATQHLLHSLQEKCDILQKEQDVAEEMRQTNLRNSFQCKSWSFNSEMSYMELEKATQNFSDSLKIGEGGFGSVYKGCLRNTTVAIKILDPRSLQGQSEFHQEVSVLSRVRHPNLVTLMGACSEAFALIYEFLPNGSLDNFLFSGNSNLNLTWQVRTRIIAEICSALIFLHSNRPHPVVHGDLKPENILLDSNLVSKVSDFGICRFLEQSNTNATLCRKTNPRGTFAYIDPEFIRTGELTPQSDIYAFGLIILRLLTRKSDYDIADLVQDSLDNCDFHNIIDRSAGDWPFVQAKRLAQLGLRCSEMRRKNRPDLVADVLPVLETMLKVASLSVPSLSFNSTPDRRNSVPSYFICPIFLEVMRDPYFAADGFTYEAEAIKGWFEGGHNASPMTNLKLSNNVITPNRALHSAIQEWLQHQQS